MRLQAIAGVCRRHSREPMAATALGRVLSREQQDPQVRQAPAIALAAQGGEGPLPPAGQDHHPDLGGDPAAMRHMEAAQRLLATKEHLYCQAGLDGGQV